MTVRVRPATAADGATVAALFHATDLHYWGSAAPSLDATAAYVKARVLAPGSGCEVVVAERDDGTAVGYATFAVLYPAPDLGGSLFMKDLFVVAEGRSAGVGEAIMRFLAEHARARGCVRFDWSAETGNGRALRFYDGLGAERLADKVYFRLDGDALRRLADGGAARAAAAAPASPPSAAKARP